MLSRLPSYGGLLLENGDDPGGAVETVDLHRPVTGKRAVWAGKIDVNPIFAEAQATYRPKQGSGMQIVGRVDHHM